MAGTFTSELAFEGGPWWAWVQIGGWGRRLNASVAAYQNAYKWSTLDPEDHGYTEANADAFHPSLIVPPSVISEAIDLRHGVTGLGDLTFSLMDVPQSQKNTEHGWQTSDVITDLMAIETQVNANGPWRLASSVSRTATTWTLFDVTGIVANQSLHIGSETVLVTEVDGGANTITVTRGVYDTAAVEHNIDSEGGEGWLYDHPRFVLGRPVSLFVNLFDRRRSHAGAGVVVSDPQALAEGQAVRVFRGVIDDWEHDGGNGWTFSCVPSLGRIDVSIGRKQFVSSLTARFADTPEGQLVNDWMANDESVNIGVRLPEPVAGGLPVDEPQYDYSGAPGSRKQEFVARLGPNLHHVHHRREIGAPKHGAFELVASGLRPIGLTLRELGQEVTWPFHDVIITHPDSSRTGETTPPWFWPEFGGIKTTHPVDIMLSLITSTGTGTNGDWDTLPRHWAAGVDVADVDLASFRRVKQRDGGLTMKNLVLGWEGKPIALRPWLEQNILAPLGWFLSHDENGQIALTAIADLYAGIANVPQLTEQDLVDTVNGQPVTPAMMQGALANTTIRQSWSWAKDPQTGDYGRNLTWQAPEAERYPEVTGDVEFAAGWFGDDFDSEIAVLSRMSLLADWLHTPLPRVVAHVGLHRIELALAQGVALTITTLPNPFTRTRGFTQHPAIVVGRSIDLSSGVMVLELMLIPSRNVGLWSPAGQVSAWTPSTKTLTLDANIHTAPDAGGEVPDTDAEGFVVGQTLMLLDSDLQVRATDNPQPTISSFPAANQVRMSGDFLEAAVPVVPNAGDFVVYAHYASGANPTTTYTDEMKRHVVQANDADELLPNGDGQYIYGG